MKPFTTLPSKRLILSYVLDWIAIIIIAGIAIAFAKTSPHHRPFSLVDLSISYPYQEGSISNPVLFVISLVAPGAIIFLVCLIFIPGRAASAKSPKSLIWRRKLWELNTGWMGLGLSLALAALFTQGMKNLFGKPRPSLLARCNPGTPVALSSYGQNFNPQWVLIDYSICQQTDMSILDDGFKSFPSGHASMSWSGLLYLSLFLCSKFAIMLPFLADKPWSESSDDLLLPTQEDVTTLERTISSIPPRNRAAAPPVYLLALPLVPIGTAIYVTSTRYFEFYHFGVDLLIGTLIGVFAAWFSFRFYHMPISRGAGWSWGARTRDRAFVIGVGRGGYVGLEGWKSAKSKKRDVEANGFHGSKPDVHPTNGIAGAGLKGERAATTSSRTNGTSEDQRGI